MSSRNIDRENFLAIKLFIFAKNVFFIIYKPFRLVRAIKEMIDQ